MKNSFLLYHVFLPNLASSLVLCTCMHVPLDLLFEYRLLHGRKVCRSCLYVENRAVESEISSLAY